MPGKHQGLERQNERLEPQDQGVHQSNCVDRMKEQPPPGADVLVGEKIVIIGVGIGDALAARWDTSEPALIELLEIHSQRARLASCCASTRTSVGLSCPAAI